MLMPVMTTYAQPIDPTVHLHPQDDVIGMTDGRVFETYTLDFHLINKFKLLDDPSVIPTGYNFQWSPDGGKLAVLLYGVPLPPTGAVLQIWDMTTLQKLYEISGVDLFTSVAWSPDGLRFAARVLTDDMTNVVRIYDAQTGVVHVEIPSGQISQLAWSLIGNQLVIDGGRYKVQVFSADTGQLLRTLNTVMDSEHDVAFSPTQNQLAFINLNDNANDLEIWNTDTGELIQKLQGHTQPVTRFIWNRGGLVSTGLDDTIRIWNPQTGKQINAFKVGRYPDAELSADGTKLLVEDRVSGIHIRDAVTGDILAVFGNILTPTPKPIVTLSATRTANPK
jgi:WD40 repeat protein